VDLVFQPVFSSLSELFGRKPLVLVTIVWFTIGAIVAGVANNFTHMLIGRSLQGIGGGGIITLTGILIADIVPLDERPNYFGMLSGIWSLGTVAGPVIGGCFAEKVTWVRMTLLIFLTEVPLTVIFSAGSSISTSRSLESEQFCLLFRGAS
jgi:MFS family permease